MKSHFYFYSANRHNRVGKSVNQQIKNSWPNVKWCTNNMKSHGSFLQNIDILSNNHRSYFFTFFVNWQHMYKFETRRCNFVSMLKSRTNYMYWKCRNSVRGFPLRYIFMTNSSQLTSSSVTENHQHTDVYFLALVLVHL